MVFLCSAKDEYEIRDTQYFMDELTESNFKADENDLQLLIDTLRKCFNAEKARYYVDEQNALFVEIDGLDALSEQEITEVAAPVLEELDMGFDEILLLPLR